MTCQKCNHKMNRLEDKKDGFLIRINYKCGNLDCKNIETIERTSYNYKSK
jgi:hypothetical protein